MPAAKLKEFLDSHGVRYVSISHSITYTAQEVAASAHVRGKEMAKTVIVRIDGKLAMAVLPASPKVDLSLLKEAVGAKQVESRAYVGVSWGPLFSPRGRVSDRMSANLALVEGRIRELAWSDLGPDGDALFRAVADSARSQLIKDGATELAAEPEADFQSRVFAWFLLPDGFQLRFKPVVVHVEPLPDMEEGDCLVLYDSVRGLLTAHHPIEDWLAH